MTALNILQKHICLSSRQLVEQHLGHAKELLMSKDPADIYSALNCLDSALKLSPHSERAIELKARALLCLRRFKDVANLLREFIPSLKMEPVGLKTALDTEKIMLLESHSDPSKVEKAMNVHCFSLFRSKARLLVALTKRGEREQWKYVILGQACCHLGMMQDAMVLLSNGRRVASAAIREESNNMPEDNFIEGTMLGADSDTVNHLLQSIKYLLRRRAAALAALEAGLYLEAARHFSKIIDGRRGTPQAFVAECCLYRAISYHAANRIVDAIADCNRSLALNPTCVESIDLRATLYETIGCFDDCLQDLDRLKSIYASGFQNQKSLWVHKPTTDTDLQGAIDFINNRLSSVRERWSTYDTIDHYRVLGISRGCTRAEVERAFLILSLKHRPDKTTHFIDRCDFVDDRQIDDVKGHARLMGLKLNRLIERAYTRVLTSMEEEMRTGAAYANLGSLTVDTVSFLRPSYRHPKELQQGIMDEYS
ncbi:hypothetical protein KP509_15G020900 [Ceratopteris richardii]|uniref:J domain-containing protein n=1 Tax=Ceratopteris richardii TaxID=49495 RepID=A0A8T2T1M2_CERRI|nr:hypothetical protein KP509_15G020900 [Ceratopteris richardii]